MDGSNGNFQRYQDQSQNDCSIISKVKYSIENYSAKFDQTLFSASDWKFAAVQWRQKSSTCATTWFRSCWPIGSKLSDRLRLAAKEHRVKIISMTIFFLAFWYFLIWWDSFRNRDSDLFLQCSVQNASQEQPNLLRLQHAGELAYPIVSSVAKTRPKSTAFIPLFQQVRDLFQEFFADLDEAMCANENLKETNIASFHDEICCHPQVNTF